MTNPKSKSLLAAFGALVLVMMTTACNVSFTTANLSSLKIGKDADVTTEAATFSPKDTVYAVAVVSNSSSKTTVKFQLIMEKVEGQADNFHVPGGDANVDLPSSGTAKYNVPAPSTGWPRGKYRIEAAMFDESGTQKEMKSGTFTVAGS